MIEAVLRKKGADKFQDNYDLRTTTMVVDIMVPTVCVIRSHKKKIESSPSMIFPQGMVATKVLPSAHTISN